MRKIQGQFGITVTMRKIQGQFVITVTMRKIQGQFVINVTMNKDTMRHSVRDVLAELQNACLRMFLDRLWNNCMIINGKWSESWSCLYGCLNLINCFPNLEIL